MRPFIHFSILLFSLFFTIESSAQEAPGRWQIKGASLIEWPVEKAHLPYTDNIEMAGKRVASIVEYSVDTAGYLSLNRQVFFPQIHPFIKSTDPGWYVYRAYSKEKYGQEVSPRLYVAGKQVVPGKLRKTTFNGILSFEHHPNEEGLVFHRKLFPSSSERLYLEAVEITNKSDQAILLTAGNYDVTSQGMEADGAYETRVWTDVPEVRKLEPGASLVYHLKFGARKAGEEIPDQTATEALAERTLFLGEMATSLRLETPDKRLNVLFELSKIRASESIFESKLGPIHSPGGGRYYVGIWANDQAEYISPFFPYLGYDLGNESAMSTYRAFAGEMNDRYEKIRYAFEVEGTVPPFLLDRGDAAMIAYGASQYALALGDRAVAEELWPLISWCLEYNHRQLNEAGVVKSESDEMEGRIETGTANLSTSSLYYGALDHASDLAASLGKSRKLVRTYETRAKALSASIEAYFGATVEGLDTYKYYKEHQYLRHWICLPLVVGINDRKVLFWVGGQSFAKTPPSRPFLKGSGPLTVYMLKKTATMRPSLKFSGIAVLFTP